VKVLVVDDDADQRYLLRRLFRRAEVHDVVEAADGQEAIEVAAAAQPDVIVLDLTMPVLSGFEALPRLREVASCPIVVLSNLPASEAEREALARGAVGFLAKRPSIEGLVSEILLLAGLLDAASDAVASGTFPADLASLSAARRFVRDALTSESRELLELVTLLVSELVTNAVVHAGTDARVEVRLRPDAVRVDVHDDDPRLPAPRSAEEGGPGGRGLPIVDQVASRWGIEPEGSGKVVWFEIDRPSAEA
jgi:CheY-like chemotaxis protein